MWQERSVSVWHIIINTGSSLCFAGFHGKFVNRRNCYEITGGI